ncbi:ferredoxin [Pseudonocardia sp. HH130629-09]|nr:ferredoxin [Pseudonocardia sp. HH130629-09]
MTRGATVTGAENRTVRVAGRRRESDGVVSLELVAADGGRLPDWTPGAHVDLVLPGGHTRQYSLCGDRWDAHRYRVAVLREAAGRGGSAWVHDRLAVGDEIGLGGPRNNFPLVPAPRYRFVAGGIGITPMLPMIATADLLGADWALLYGGRTRGSMAFTAELAAHGDRVRTVPQEEQGLLDLPGFLGAPAPDTRVYGCGPAPLLTALARATAGWPSHAVRTERFVPRATGAVRDTAFEVHLARRGTDVTVPPGRSVLDAVADAGVDVLSSCRQGTCGTCETTVLAGVPDHRDSVLDDDDERAAADCMLVCVSRSVGPRLVLDL